MNEIVNTIVVNLKEATDKACDLATKLAAATLDFEIQKHKIRNELYDAKQSGTKITEEAIRTESIVQCEHLYRSVETIKAALDVEKMKIECYKYTIEAMKL